MTLQSRSRASSAAATIASIAGIAAALYYLDIPSLLQHRLNSRKVERRCYSTNDKPPLTAFKTLTNQRVVHSTYPLACQIEKNIPIYDAAKLELDVDEDVNRLQDEWHHILLSGPGVFVVKHFFNDLSIIDATNLAYDSITTREKAESGTQGDHFAVFASKNTRIWNSFSKHCLQDPQSFVKYYSNPLFKLVSEAWLGPSYRITAQLNIVHPGGLPQTCHRDYHLGFQTVDDAARWPKTMHHVSQYLTLQGAVAHSDMPLESGPTRLLPFSHIFEEGFMAYRLPEFNEYFLQNYVTVPLGKGDAIYFNPALFHAAGENQTTHLYRSANLIQISSAFGKTMETIDSIPLVKQCWDTLVHTYNSEGMSAEVDGFVRALGEGYPFPTNLDKRPPAPGGMAPESEQDILLRGLSEGWNTQQVVQALTQLKHASTA